MHNNNRRKFLKSSAALAAGVSVFGMPGIIRAGANGLLLREYRAPYAISEKL